jgi:hypothetical protein
LNEENIQGLQSEPTAVKEGDDVYILLSVAMGDPEIKIQNRGCL